MTSTSDDRRLYGVYRTPPALTGYIVRSVDLLIRTRLGRPAGLADPGVRVLDPAAGAMNFIRAAWAQAIRNRREVGDVHELIRSHLLPSFRGVELREEEHARGVAATRRFLAAMGYAAGPSDPQPAVLADSLVPPPGLFDVPANVVLGNPPWRGGLNHRGAWIGDLLRGYPLPDGSEEEGYFQVDGEPLGERNTKWLQDDYVRGVRLAQWLIDRSGEGVAGFVLNHNFLDAPTFRGMRRSLLRTFEQVFVLDLHGNRRRRESGWEGGEDENVFAGVAQGATVLLLLKKPGLDRLVMRADLRGSRQEKLRFLARNDLRSTPWRRAEPDSPSYLFLVGDRQLAREYRQWPSLPEIFPVSSSGIITGRDALVTAFDRRTLEDKLSAQRGRQADTGTAAADLGEIRLAGDPDWRSRITEFLARPFDVRFLFYASYLLERPRIEGMSHLRRGDNLGLITTRQCQGEPGAFVTRRIAGHKVLSGYDVSTVFPLYLQSGPVRRPNISPKVADRLGHCYGEEVVPEDLLGYVYALLYSPNYRRRFRDLLRRGFPRIAFPAELWLFSKLARLGRELMGLHLLQDPRLDEPVAYWKDDLPPGREVEGLSLEGVDPAVWSYRIGDHPVLAQWIHTRKRRVLSESERRDLPRIIEAMCLTLKVQARFGELYRAVQEN